ncbi:nuclease-related domain-containing protein [Caballeronia sp. J97]|uniref:nuclease-related domain-containing protein n=1 Tax=Caballeronia sp. J97 TaxID=2805429 RepID=UPI002AAF2AD8|nr:nuclease-related domain-containing protein [Caballeronia sp. J97]
MFFEIVVAVGAYCVYHGCKRSRKRYGASPSPHLVRRSEAIGAAGEAAAQTQLRKTLSGLCGNDFYLHDGLLVLEHAPGTDFPTAEIDRLAVTPFGIFIFETKNWSGYIAPSVNVGKLVRTAQSGLTDERRSPIEQNRSKLRFLRGQLPPIWPVHGAGLFTSAEAVLDPHLPADLLGLGDLPHWLRTQRDAFKGAKPVHVELARNAILLFADGSPAALEKHKTRLLTPLWPPYPRHKLSSHASTRLGNPVRIITKVRQNQAVKRLLTTHNSTPLCLTGIERGGEKGVFRSKTQRDARYD